MGREEELESLADLLKTSGQVAIAAATGMGGIGKTQLAWQYAHHQQNQYPGGIWWLRAESFVQQVFGYGQRMGLPVPQEITQETEQMWWFYEQWRRQIPVGERLLVVDDVQDYGKLKPLLPSHPLFRVLLTTRQRIGDETVRRLEIETLKPLDAYELFYKQINLHLRDKIDQRLEREQRQAEKLCQWLGYLPLGIKVVAAFLMVEPNLSFIQMQQRLEAEKIKNESLSTVEAAFEISWEKFTPPERQLACLLGLFASAPIPWHLVAESLERCEVKPVKMGLWQRIITKPRRLFTKPQPLQQWCLLLDQKQQEKARRRLVELNCLTYSGEEKYDVHSLLHKFYGEKLWTELGDRAETLQRSFAETLTNVAKTIGSSLTQTDIPKFAETLPHMEIVANKFTHLLENSTDKIWSSTGLARVAEFQSRWQDAEKWHKKSLETSETQLGADHPETATSLDNLANLYYAMGRYSEAEPLFGRSLQRSENQLGADHPETATSLNNLAAFYYAMGRYSEAEPLFGRALQINETQLGADHPYTATSLNNLANLYKSMRRYSEAETLLGRSLHINETHLGADHPDTAASLNNLAEIYRAMGRYSEAEPLLGRSLQIKESQMGADHPDTAQSLNNLALLYESMGRYSEAELLYGRSLQIWETQLGADHPYTATSLNNLALLYQDIGRYSEAEPLLGRSLQIRETKLGADHPSTASSMNNLAELYRAMGRDSEVEPLLERSLHINETHLGADHPDTASSMNNLAALYYATGRYSEAEPLYGRSLQIRETQLGADHSDTAQSLKNLAVLYYAMGRYSEAELLFLRTLEIRSKSLGVSHPNTQEAWGNFCYFIQQALANNSADTLSSHPLTQQLLQQMRE